MDKLIEKIAQRRGLLNKIREKTNISGIAAEKYFNPELQQVMDHLRDVDDGVRAIAIGQAVGEANAPEDPISLKQILKSVKSNLARREYMKAAADLGRFHKKVFDIAHLLSLFTANIDKAHKKFLFQDLDEETANKLKYLANKWKPKAADYFTVSLIKNAGIMDFLHNIGTERGRALAYWEKTYPGKVKKLKEQTISLLSQSEKLNGTINQLFADLAKARAVRNPDNYINVSNKMINEIKKYDESDRGFRKYYEENIKGDLEQFFKEQEEAAAKKDQEAAPVSNVKIPSALPIPSLKINNPVRPIAAPLDVDFGQEKQNVSPQNIAPKQEEKTHSLDELIHKKDPVSGDITLIDPDTSEIIGHIEGNNPPAVLSNKPAIVETKPVVPEAKPVPAAKPVSVEQKPAKKRENLLDFKLPLKPPGKKAEYTAFLKSLEALADESPLMLSKYISKYAKLIFENDPETALSLMKIAARAENNDGK
jgi:hypothetical protein